MKAGVESELRFSPRSVNGPLKLLLLEEARIVFSSFNVPSLAIDPPAMGEANPLVWTERPELEANVECTSEEVAALAMAPPDPRLLVTKVDTRVGEPPTAEFK